MVALAGLALRVSFGNTALFAAFVLAACGAPNKELTMNTVDTTTRAAGITPTRSLQISVRRSADRGRGSHGWLESRHTFSFAEYHDPAHMGFGPLRVINEDVVAPGRGFGMHPHRDMEIISYVLSGELEHADSLGHRGVIKPGEVQRISAGSGLMHSEANPSRTTPVHFLQIWITPSERGGTPGYEQRSLLSPADAGSLRRIISPDGAAGTIAIRQDASVYAGVFPNGGAAAFDVAAGRRAWLQIARGTATINGHRLEAGDAAAVTGMGRIDLVFETSSEALLFDLP